MKQGAKKRLLRAMRKAKGLRLPVFLQPPLSGWGRFERLLRQARAGRLCAGSCADAPPGRFPCGVQRWHPAARAAFM